ncbi:MAG: dihydroneopterin aldolase [Synergistales bacterium]|nr:dihydroneopterin aldolase [Synergistales bacterium]
MRNVLRLRGMQFHAFHGSLEVERELGQVLDLSLEVSYDLPVEQLDDPDAAPNYAAVYELTKEVVMNTKFYTMEALGFAIARRLFRKHRQLETVTATLSRGQLYVPGVLSDAEVALTVSRADVAE